MKFSCNGTDLANATNIVSKALAANKNIPILEGIRMEARGDSLTLSAYNQELYIQKTIHADVFAEGDLVVNGRMLNDYANKISFLDKIEIEKQLNNKLSFSFNKSSSEINFYDIQNFPSLGEIVGQESVKIKEGDLKELFECTIFCAAVNDSRAILKSCKLELVGDVMEAVCLDGYRVGIARKKPESYNGNFKAIILGKIISDITKILTDSDDVVTIQKSGSTVIFDLGHTKIRATTVEGDFYKYESSLPRNIRTEVVVNKDEFEQCLNRAGIISREHFYNNIIITVEDNVINVFSESEKGKVNENVDCKSVGESVKIGLNNKFLQEALSRIKEDYVKIQIESATRPILISRMEGDEYRCIVLPVRMV